MLAMSHPSASSVPVSAAKTLVGSPFQCCLEGQNLQETALENTEGLVASQTLLALIVALTLQVVLSEDAGQLHKLGCSKVVAAITSS